MVTSSIGTGNFVCNNNGSFFLLGLEWYKTSYYYYYRHNYVC